MCLLDGFEADWILLILLLCGFCPQDDGRGSLIVFKGQSLITFAFRFAHAQLFSFHLHVYPD